MSGSEAQSAPAVALLARPGAARERLREALSHADVQLVLEDDPNGLEPQLLQDAQRIDAQIKGQAQGSPWTGLARLALLMAGQRLALPAQ